MADKENEIGHYSVGYVHGAYDLFHVGHLRLLKRCKDHCDYLIVGIDSDELVQIYKNRKPCIPEEERLEIVKAVKYVDDAVIVDYHNIDTKDAWELYQFNVQFCGDDHEKESQITKKYLQSLGADMVFFPYTMSTSSSKIRANIKAEIKEQGNTNV